MSVAMEHNSEFIAPVADDGRPSGSIRRIEGRLAGVIFPSVPEFPTGGAVA